MAVAFIPMNLWEVQDVWNSTGRLDPAEVVRAGAEVVMEYSSVAGAVVVAAVVVAPVVVVAAVYSP